MLSRIQLLRYLLPILFSSPPPNANQVIRMVDVQTTTIVIAAISVVIGVINSIMSNREAQQTRERARNETCSAVYADLHDNL